MKVLKDKWFRGKMIDGDVGLEGAYFECNEIAKISEILKGGGEEWFPLGVCGMEKEEHGSVAPINSGREHGEEASKGSIGIMGCAEAERYLRCPWIGRWGVGSSESDIKEDVIVRGGWCFMDEVMVMVDNPFLEYEEEALFIESVL